MRIDEYLKSNEKPEDLCREIDELRDVINSQKEEIAILESMKKRYFQDSADAEYKVHELENQIRELKGESK